MPSSRNFNGLAAFRDFPFAQIYFLAEALSERETLLVHANEWQT